MFKEPLVFVPADNNFPPTLYPPTPLYCFDDFLIQDNYSTIPSRTSEHISLNTTIGKMQLTLPVISANMDTITEEKMADAMFINGGCGALHRFSSIDRQLEMFRNSPSFTFVSVGIKDEDLKNAYLLREAGAKHFIIDVAHGANRNVAIFMDKLKENVDPDTLVVGNFGSAIGLERFLQETNHNPDGVKIGIGGGSMCTTRIVTGVGMPTLQSVADAKYLLRDSNIAIIADGGIRNSGDIAKSLAAGAHAVMLGGMLAGTDETPGEVIGNTKKYRGSASKESYDVQGKINRAPEGEMTWTSVRGPVKNVLDDIKGGLMSSFSYVGANDLTSFQSNAILQLVSNNTQRENGAHGK